MERYSRRTLHKGLFHYLIPLYSTEEIGIMPSRGMFIHPPFFYCRNNPDKQNPLIASGDTYSRSQRMGKPRASE